MRNKRILAVSMAIGIVVSAAAAAQAGGAGGAANLGAFFVCQSINGANVGAVVNTHEFDPPGTPGLGPVIHANVSVGNAVLHCRQVDVTDTQGNVLTPPPFTTGELKCYTVNFQGPAAPVQLSLLDAFYPAGETVRAFAPPTVLCAPTLPLAN